MSGFNFGFIDLGLKARIATVLSTDTSKWVTDTSFRVGVPRCSHARTEACTHEHHATDARPFVYVLKCACMHSRSKLSQPRLHNFGFTFFLLCLSHIQ